MQRHEVVQPEKRRPSKTESKIINKLLLDLETLLTEHKLNDLNAVEDWYNLNENNLNIIEKKRQLTILLAILFHFYSQLSEAGHNLKDFYQNFPSVANLFIDHEALLQFLNNHKELSRLSNKNYFNHSLDIEYQYLEIIQSLKEQFHDFDYQFCNDFSDKTQLNFDKNKFTYFLVKKENKYRAYRADRSFVEVPEEISNLVSSNDFHKGWYSELRLKDFLFFESIKSSDPDVNTDFIFFQPSTEIKKIILNTLKKETEKSNKKRAEEIRKQEDLAKVENYLDGLKKKYNNNFLFKVRVDLDIDIGFAVTKKRAAEKLKQLLLGNNNVEPFTHKASKHSLKKHQPKL